MLDVNTELMKPLKHHRLNPTDSKCLSLKREILGAGSGTGGVGDRAREGDRETSSIKIQKIITSATPPPC